MASKDAFHQPPRMSEADRKAYIERDIAASRALAEKLAGGGHHDYEDDDDAEYDSDYESYDEADYDGESQYANAPDDGVDDERRSEFESEQGYESSEDEPPNTPPPPPPPPPPPTFASKSGNPFGSRMTPKSYDETSEAGNTSGHSNEDGHDNESYYAAQADNYAGLGALDGFELLEVASPERPIQVDDDDIPMGSAEPPQPTSQPNARDTHAEQIFLPAMPEFRPRPRDFSVEPESMRTGPYVPTQSTSDPTQRGRRRESFATDPILPYSIRNDAYFARKSNMGPPSAIPRWGISSDRPPNAMPPAPRPSSSGVRSGSDPHFKVPDLPSARTENFPHPSIGNHQSRGPTPPVTSRLSRHDGNFATDPREQATERRPATHQQPAPEPRIHAQRSSIPQQSRDQPQHDRQWASSSSVPITPSGVRDDNRPMPSHFTSSSAESSKLINPPHAPIPKQPIPYASNPSSSGSQRRDDPRPENSNPLSARPPARPLAQNLNPPVEITPARASSSSSSRHVRDDDEMEEQQPSRNTPITPPDDNSRAGDSSSSARGSVRKWDQTPRQESRPSKRARGDHDRDDDRDDDRVNQSTSSRPQTSLLNLDPVSTELYQTMLQTAVREALAVTRQRIPVPSRYDVESYEAGYHAAEMASSARASQRRVNSGFLELERFPDRNMYDHRSSPRHSQDGHIDATPRASSSHHSSSRSNPRSRSHSDTRLRSSRSHNRSDSRASFHSQSHSHSRSHPRPGSPHQSPVRQSLSRSSSYARSSNSQNTIPNHIISEESISIDFHMRVFHLNALLGDVKNSPRGPLSNLLEHYQLKDSSKYGLHKIVNLWDGFDATEDRIGQATLDHRDLGVISEILHEWAQILISTPRAFVCYILLTAIPEDGAEEVAKRMIKALPSCLRSDAQYVTLRVLHGGSKNATKRAIKLVISRGVGSSLSEGLQAAAQVLFEHRCSQAHADSE